MFYQICYYFYTAHALALLIVLCYGMAREHTRAHAMQIAQPICIMTSLLGVMLFLSDLFELCGGGILYDAIAWFPWALSICYLAMHIALLVPRCRRSVLVLTIIAFVLGGGLIYERMNNLLIMHSTSRASGIANDFPDWVAPSNNDEDL